MRRHRGPSSGFSFIELMVVVGIIGALSVAGYMYMVDNRAPAVKSLLDEIEGVLSAAQRNTMSGTGDVVLISQGTWKGTTEESALFIDGRRFDPTKSGTVFDRNRRIGSQSEFLRASYATDRRHQLAGIDTSGGGDFATAIAGSMPTLSPEMMSVLGTPFCTGGDNQVTVNGYTKRFTNGFYIAVIGLRNGSPLPNGPVGLIVVPTNSAGIYKYFKGDGDSTWRRL